MTNNFSSTAAFIWAVADLLRGDFKQSQYGRIILPFTLLRRLECVLEPTKAKVLKAAETHKAKPPEVQEKFLLRAADLAFYNTSPMDLSKLGETGTRDNLDTYVQSFSRDAREIFDNFHFSDFIADLAEDNLLYKVVQKFAGMDLSPQAISNYEMGLVFEELIRRFAESSNETAGEHFTPRDIVRLTTALVFMEDDDALAKPGTVRSIYDPTAGTGGFLSSGTEYLHELNPNARMAVFGQELNSESYAICKADMLIKGQAVENIKLGNTLSNDQLSSDKFDYMLSNPPFGVDWKKVEQAIKDEHTLKGFDGRFGPGLPRVSDGSLLFLMHLISKMRSAKEGGSRIGIILNGSPLFTGGAGSGESEIRRYLLEADLVEAIIALPTDMFYNTGIATYIWVLSNHKPQNRKGKVQLINATEQYAPMRKSLGSKRRYLTEEQIEAITREFGKFRRGKTTKIFNTSEFGYRRISVERPLRLSAQLSDERIAQLRFAPKPLQEPMRWAWEHFGEELYDKAKLKQHGEAIKHHLKARGDELKPAKVKELLAHATWQAQRDLMEAAQQLQAEMGSEQWDDFNRFEPTLTLTLGLKAIGYKPDAKQKKQLIDALSWKNPEAAPVIKKVHKGGGVDYQPDSDLRDNENIPLGEDIEAYFKREVLPHVEDAWIDEGKRDEKDGEVGIVGYEIPFNRHFYQYQPPRALEEIDADLDKVSGEIMALLSEVHS